MNRILILRWALGLLGVLLLWTGLEPAWHLWRTHEAQLNELAQQRQAMQRAQEELQALQQKTLPSTAEAQNRIQAIAQQQLKTVAQGSPGAGIRLTLNGVAPQQLAQAWADIRSQTSASVVQADLVQGPQGWSGTLVFKLAQRP